MRHQSCQWRVHPGTSAERLSPALKSWLLDTTSLTARLRARCGDGFSVRVVAEGWRRPSVDESRRLHTDRRRLAWIREVVLLCHGQPQVFARSVIPAHSLRGRNRTLRMLGNRPLGELLFAGCGTQRSATEIACLRPRDWLMERVHRAVPEALTKADELWARRVVHRLRARPILVAEVFLPELINRP